MEGDGGIDCSAGFAPKRGGLVGDCPDAGAVVLLNKPPPPMAPNFGGAVFPLPKIDGFEVMLLFASGEVCMESPPSPAVD